MPFDNFRSRALAVCLAIPAGVATAQLAHEDSTAPVNPEEVAYLRVITPVGESARIDGRNLVPAPDAPASPYATVDETPEIIVADVRATLQTPLGGHYSYLWGIAGSGEVVEDMMPASDDEAVIRVYNLSSVDGIELWIAGQEGASIAGLGPVGSEGIAMVPGTLTAEVRANGESVGVIEDLQLSAGEALSVAVWGDPGRLGLEAFTDSYE